MVDPQKGTGGVPKSDHMRAPPGEAQGDQASAQRGVLVVDDDRVMRGACAQWARDHGYPVWVAEHGGRAIELYRSRHAEIALVLLDVWMPGLDGPHTLRALQGVNPHVRCCFLTAGHTRYTEEELLGEGADLVLMKPPDWARLGALLADAAREPERPPTPGPTNQD